MTSQMARAAGLAAAFLYSLTIVRFLDPSIGGAFLFALVLMAGVGIAGRFGVDTLILAEVNWRRGASRRRLYRISFCTSLAAATVLFVILDRHIFASVGGNSAVMAPALAFSGLFQSLAILDAASLRTQGHYIRGALAEIGLTQALACVLTIVLFWCLPDLATGTGAAGIHLLASSITVCVTSRWRMHLSRTEPAPALKPQRVPVRRLFRLTAASLALFAWVWIPSSLAWLVAGPEETAALIVATRIATLVGLFQTTQTNSLIPLVVAWRHSRQVDVANSAIHRAYKLAAIVGVLVAVVLAIFANALMSDLSGLSDRAALLRVVVLCATLHLPFGLIIPLGTVTGAEPQILACLGFAIPVGYILGWLVYSQSGLVLAVLIANLTMIAALSLCAALIRRQSGLRVSGLGI